MPSAELGAAMQRREFIGIVSGAAAWPLVVRAQQPSTTKRVAILINLQESDPEGQARLALFLQGLRTSGWTQGNNLETDIRWEPASRAHAQIRCGTGCALARCHLGFYQHHGRRSATGDAKRAYRFRAIYRPVGAGVVATLSRPGGNGTGFTSFEYGMSGKWLELLNRFCHGLETISRRDHQNEKDHRSDRWSEKLQRLLPCRAS
jgi:putative tryptophan/tyrosine transport system substrate-binding protein